MTVDQFGITKLYPTTGGGLEWFNNWQGGQLRYINNDTFDATDARSAALISRHGGARLTVNCGLCHLQLPGETRLFVDGPWTNTEMTIFIKIKDTTTSSIQLRGRANHFGVGLEPYASESQYVDPNPQGVPDIISCGFGNYFIRWGQSTNPLTFVDAGVEIIHELYKTGLARVDPYNIPNDQWIGYKLVTRTLSGGHVKIEGYNNMNEDLTTWDLATEFEFDGSNATIDNADLTYWQTFLDFCDGKGDNLAPDVNAHQLFTSPAKWNLIRINTPSKLDMKYFSVREIVPF